MPKPVDEQYSPTFFDFLAEVRRSWLTVGVFILLGLGVASIFLALYQPRFRAYTEFSLPTQADIADANAFLRAVRTANAALGVDVVKIEATNDLMPADVFDFFVKNVSANKENFFEKVYVPSQNGQVPTAKLRQKFEDGFVVLNKAGEAAPVVQVVAMDTDPARAWQLVQMFTEQSMQSSRTAMRSMMKAQVKLGQDILDEKIEMLRQRAEFQRQAYVKRLQDAYQMAVSMGLDEPVYQGEDLLAANTAPIYLRGAKALKAELDAVRDRRNNDPYIEDLSELLLYKNVLEQLVLNFESMQFAKVLIAPESTVQPLSPTKAVVLAAGAGLGALFALLFILTRLAWQAHPSRSESMQDGRG